MREFHDKEQFTPDTWRVIDSGGILGNDYRRIVDSFDIGASLNKRISKPIGHIAVSFDKADLPRLTDDFMVQLAKEYMEQMGIRGHTISDCAPSRNRLPALPYRL